MKGREGDEKWWKSWPRGAACAQRTKLRDEVFVSDGVDGMGLIAKCVVWGGEQSQPMSGRVQFSSRAHLDEQ